MTPIPPFPQPQPDARPSSLRNMIVTQTYVIQRQDGAWFYQIHLAPDLDPRAPKTILVTTDEAVYELALKLEGNEAARVDASYHFSRRGSYRYSVLDTLAVRAA